MIKIKKLLYDDRANALIEFLIMLPIYIFLLVAITWTSRAYIVKIKLNNTTRNIAWMPVYNKEIEIKDMEDKIIEFEENIGWGGINDYDVYIDKGIVSLAKPTYCEIKYDIPLPEFVRQGIWYINGDRSFSGNITIKSKNAVYGNTWKI